MPKQPETVSTKEQSGEELIAAMRKDYAGINEKEMFSRYRKMYRCQDIAIEKIAVFTGPPTDPLLDALFKLMPRKNAYHGATNISAANVRRRVRELGMDQHKFQPMHMVMEKGVAHLLNGRHTAVALVVLGATSLPLVEYPSEDEQERFRVVISANETRHVGRYERVQHSVWQVTGGKSVDAEKLFTEMVRKPADKAVFAAHCLIELGEPALKAKFGGDQKIADAINPPGLLQYLRTALGTELVDGSGKELTYRSFRPSLRRASSFLDGYYAQLARSDRFQPGQQLGPLLMQAIGKVVHTLDDAGDDPAPFAGTIADYVLKHTDVLVKENATNIAARLRNVVQRAKGRSE